VGVARAFAYGGLNGQQLWAEVRPLHGERGDRHEHTPIHEYKVKLTQIRGRLLTDSGGAWPRTPRFMSRFLSAGTRSARADLRERDHHGRLEEQRSGGYHRRRIMGASTAYHLPGAAAPTL